MPDQFSRLRLQFGAEGVERLQRAHVAVFGIGGVGGHCVEALARSGVGRLTLIDNDKVTLTNLNRQVIALHSTLGRDKVDVMRERIADINPECRVEVRKCFYLPETAGEIPLEQFDYVIDCVDTLTAKLELAQRCRALGVREISSMGTANKLDPTKLVVTDLSKTTNCHLARVLRKELRNRGIHHLKVVCSTELALEPDTDLPDAQEPTNKRALPSSNAFVPAVAGLILAGEVLRELAGVELTR